MTNKHKTRSKTSQRWLQEHFNDPFVKQAQREGYRSRAVYKLLELQQRDKLLSPGMVVVDLGAAPGGWSQLLTKLVLPGGKVIALDILPMDPLLDVDFIQGDFMEEAVLQQLLALLQGQTVTWVLSDMSPNMSGINSVDQPRAIYLAELALAFASEVLGRRGGFVTKLFQGEGFDSFLLEVRRRYQTVTIRKPEASRSRSREVYLVARNLKVSDI